MVVLRTIGILAVVALLCAYIYSTLQGPQGISALAAKREEIRALQEENANLKQDVEAKSERIRQLKESQSEQELEIRKRMKLVKPGETVFIITDKHVPKPPPAPPKPASAPAATEAAPPKPATQFVSPDDAAAAQSPKPPTARKSTKAKSDEAAEKKSSEAKSSEPPAAEPPQAEPPKDPPANP